MNVRGRLTSIRFALWAPVLLFVLLANSTAMSVTREEVAVRSIGFALNSAAISREAARTLAEVRVLAQRDSSSRVELVGHTCDLASSAYNERLAQRRAEASRRWLVQADPTLAPRVSVASRGAAQPAVSNVSDTGRARNRRVEIRIITTIPVADPEIAVSVTPATIFRGETAVLAWTSRHARRVEIAPEPGLVDTEGSIEIRPANSQRFQATAVGEGGVAEHAAEITVRVPPPTLRISASPLAVTKGQPITVSWTATDADRIEIAGVGIDLAPSGSRVVTPGSPTTFAGVATGEGGRAEHAATVVVTPPQPTVTLTVSPATIDRCQSATLTWSSTDASFVEIAPGIGRAATSGTLEVSPTLATTYVATAVGEGGRDVAAASVGVHVPAPSVTLLVAPGEIAQGEGATLTWTSANADFVEIAPGIGRVPASGTLEVRPSLATSYVATASGPGGRDAATATVAVRLPPPPPPPAPSAPAPRPVATVMQEARVAVVGDDGRFRTDLASRDFEVLVDGETRQIVRVIYEPEARTAGVVLVLDRSASMVEAMPALRDAAEGFVRLKKDEDRVLIMAFSSDIEVLGDFNTEQLALVSSIRGITPRGQTRLYDALFTAAERVSVTAPPRYILLMTDGVDEAGLFGTEGSRRSIEDAIRKVQAAGATVFTIGMGAQCDSGILRRIAEESGGSFYYAPDRTRLAEIYARLSTGLLRGSYRVEYLTTGPDAERARVNATSGRVVD